MNKYLKQFDDVMVPNIIKALTKLKIDITDIEWNKLNSPSLMYLTIEGIEFTYNSDTFYDENGVFIKKLPPSLIKKQENIIQVLDFVLALYKAKNFDLSAIRNMISALNK